MAASETPNAGLTRASAPTMHSRALVEVVARKFGVSPLRQFADMWRLKGGQTRIVAREYYEYQLYLPDLSLAQKKEFVGERGSLALNLRLAPPGFTNMRNFLADKVGLTTLMGGLGLPTTRIQACYHPFRGFGATRTLRSAAEIRSFLTDQARFPLFGKPIRGAGSFGSVSILGLQGEVARLANGTSLDLTVLCAQIEGCSDYGYVFQDAVTPHPLIEAVSGARAVSTIRAVTVNANDRPQMLYALWKLPAATAMSDNFWQAGSLIALVNCVTGMVEKVRHGSGIDTQWVTAHPATGLPLPLRKRLELAKALATRPKVLLLDEVMAGLNPTEVDELIAFIRRINAQGVGILLIEHVMRGVMALASRVLVINYGQLIAQGTPQEVVGNQEVIEAYLGRGLKHA